jgi:hypothetical protein
MADTTERTVDDMHRAIATLVLRASAHDVTDDGHGCCIDCGTDYEEHTDACVVLRAQLALDDLAAYAKALEAKVVEMESDIAMLDGTIKTMVRLTEIRNALSAEGEHG